MRLFDLHCDTLYEAEKNGLSLAHNELADVYKRQPWDDMENLMRQHQIPLYGLESGDPIADFDFIGFTLQYELSYSNVLNMLDLAHIPLLARDRTGLRLSLIHI